MAKNMSADRAWTLVDLLRGAVISMDASSQRGMAEIAAIAELALLALETPSAERRLESFAAAFEAIKTKAEMIDNCISSAAQDVGCSFANEAAQRRRQARKTARASSGAGIAKGGV